MAKRPLNDARALASFIRKCLEAFRESTVLRAILTLSVQNQVCPSDWKEQLEAAKTSSQYADIGREIESMIVRFEQDADETELIARIQKMTEGPIN